MAWRPSFNWPFFDATVQHLPREAECLVTPKSFAEKQVGFDEFWSQKLRNASEQEKWTDGKRSMTFFSSDGH